MPTLARDDYDGSIHAQVDRARAANLGDVGLPGPRVAVAGRQGGRGALRAAEVQHGAGSTTGPTDWSRVARDSLIINDPPCAHCHDPVMTWRRDGRGRPAHLVCRIRVRRRAEADR